MLWLCSLCGRKNPSSVTVCSCGNTVDELPDAPVSGPALEDVFPSEDTEKDVELKDPFTAEPPATDVPKPKPKPKTPAQKPGAQTLSASADEILIKEVNAWRYVYSMADESIHLTTPALPGFRITLSATDLEELLEIIFEYTGAGKTFRSIEFPKDAVREIVEQIGGLIEERRSKIRVKLNPEDLDKLGELINGKLKD